MTRQISRYAVAVLAVTLLSLTGTARAQDAPPEEAATPAANAEEERDQLAAEVKELKAMLQNARQALDQAREQAEHQRKLAEEARAHAAKKERSTGGEEANDEKPTITQRIEQASLEHAARKAGEFVSKQRQRLMSGGEEEEEDESSNKKSKRHEKHRGGERIVSVRLNLDILVVKRPEAKKEDRPEHDEHHSSHHAE